MRYMETFLDNDDLSKQTEVEEVFCTRGKILYFEWILNPCQAIIAFLLKLNYPATIKKLKVLIISVNWYNK